MDVNAHNHVQVGDTFLTPWHLLLYSGVAANGLFLSITHFRNTGRGYPWRRALPEGYFLSLVGVFVFLAGIIGLSLSYLIRPYANQAAQ